MNDTQDRGRFEAGLAIRKEVLGAAHVERLARRGERLQPSCAGTGHRVLLGAVWAREGLDRRTRSLLNLAILTTLNRGHELSVHVRGAIANGITESEIQEALLQTAIYAGVPAALESFRIAERTLAELRAEGVTIP
ncbi:carboxymuconolactone decarboxylase family protein [Sphaerisporangium aureirubrum]|uniref:Carboxymuconolactone decarboxylase family protein n=1 Tax=Sphaerisporangium aureirubrum TaxID=1544736 RepID=A0ABW1NKR6_9ACTN